MFNTHFIGIKRKEDVSIYTWSSKFCNANNNENITTYLSFLDDFQIIFILNALRL